MLAICAAIQVLGHWYETSAGERVDGISMLGLTTTPQGVRSIGELVTTPTLPGLTQQLTGFENHRGGTTLGPDSTPLARVVSGHGNREGGRIDGAVTGSVIGTNHRSQTLRRLSVADAILVW